MAISGIHDGVNTETAWEVGEENNHTPGVWAEDTYVTCDIHDLAVSHKKDKCSKCRSDVSIDGMPDDGGIGTP